ncbi:hypothetical protein CO731_01260 [Aminobacter sp. MSH1]|uniref:hypothetical protein n=1 Tax=Aminobacter sp. MSH1 TaxID=374606 RepID=UPI000D504BAD|nr:hypothetical protein [Aminobacter sp. MSH1]AWC21807.1 hypothetical protein CO731_01260 [Aminobacter sp. MSH1]
MPSVPSYQPGQVRDRPIHQQGITVRATPDDMGAAIGRGMESAAAGVAQVGDALARVKALEDETIARRGRNEYMSELDALRYDPEGGYLQRTGKDAIDGLPAYNTKLAELRQKHAAKMTPAQQNLFAAAVDPLEADARRSGLIHKGNSLKEFVVEEARNGAENLKNEALINYRDSAQWQKYTSAGLQEIATLGEKLGWTPEQLKQQQSDYLSDAHRLTALQLAGDDPVAATEYALKHRDNMSASDHLTLMREIMPLVGDAVTRDATVNASKPGARQFAASGLPSEAYSLLGVIAGTESPGYDVINGGSRFSSFSDHPRQKGAGGTSTAAGRYQVVKGTWDRVAGALGLPDFSPISQDVAAWWLAQQDYKTRTGRDLTADLRGGNYAEVRAGLGATWEGIHKLSDKQFSERMQASGGAVETGKVVFSPRVEGMLAGLPANYAARLRESADTGLSTFLTQQNAQIKAHRVAVVDDYKLRIASDDTSLTRAEILDDPIIDKGDKATILNSLAEKLGDTFKTQKAVEAFQAGRLAIDPYDSDGRKLTDNVWKSIATTVEPARLRPVMEDLVRQTGIVPQPVANAIRADLTSGKVANVAGAARLALSLHSIDTAAFDRRDGGKEIQDAAVAFSHLTGNVGLSAEAAAQRLIDMRDPEKLRERTALMQSKPIKDFVDGQAVESAVRDIFDPGLIGTDPKLGETPAQSAAMVVEYRSLLEESLFDAAGDQDTAKALAADRFRRRYGTSDFSISGSKVVTRLPPEVVYPAGKDGTHDYIRQQVKAALSAAGAASDKVFLQADGLTDRDFKAGKPARYQVWYEKDGVLEMFRLPFFAVPPSRADLAAAKRERSELKRDENRSRLEAGRDREGNLDRFLDGNPLTGEQ